MDDSWVRVRPEGQVRKLVAWPPHNYHTTHTLSHALSEDCF